MGWMMTNPRVATKAQVEEWASRVESTLPTECPDCDGSLRVVRYHGERTDSHVRLTGVTLHGALSLVARCPTCDHELLREYPQEQEAPRDEA